jgi:hypothetical protein
VFMALLHCGGLAPTLRFHLDEGILCPNGSVGG